MALQLAHEDQFGTSHPEAYWKLTGFEYSNEQRQARLTFSCYVNKAAADAGKNSLAIRTFLLTGDLYDQVNDLLTTAFKGAAYGVAKQFKDIDTGERDEDNNPVLTSFFADAADV